VLGIVIDSNAEQEHNALDAININMHSSSNETDDNDVQKEKHSDSMVSTFRGIMISFNDEHE
jgi:hypothetical protein